MLKALILTAIACLLNIGAPVAKTSVVLNVYEEQSEYIELDKHYEKLVSYVDEEYQISLNANELNNYTFDNLCNLFNDESYVNYFSGTSIKNVTNNNVYNYDEYLPNDSLGYVYNANYYMSLNLEDYNFYLNDSIEDTYPPFEDSYLWQLNSTNYSAIKQAIELDIQANTQSENMPSISDIFTEIATAITNFITTLASAFNGVTTLFWDASANSNAGGFTFLGVLVLIGCGCGLVYGAYRIIKGLMHRV